MAAVNNPLANQNQYDCEIPPHFICPITDDLMGDPFQANCGEGHTFERELIENWVNAQHTCPIDRANVTQLSPNRALAASIAQWRDEHLVVEIEPPALVEAIFSDNAPQVDARAMAAYMRYIKAVQRIHDMVTEVVNFAREQEVSIFDLEDRVEELSYDDRTMTDLRQIIGDAEREGAQQQVLERQPLTPRSNAQYLFDMNRQREQDRAQGEQEQREWEEERKEKDERVGRLEADAYYRDIGAATTSGVAVGLYSCAFNPVMVTNPGTWFPWAASTQVVDSAATAYQAVRHGAAASTLCYGLKKTYDAVKGCFWPADPHPHQE